LKAASLETIQATRVFNICANPEALPYTSDLADTQGFQLELHREIAALMGWQPTVTWVYNRLAAARLDCGGFMGRTLVSNSIPVRGSLPTRPYMGSGFVFVLPPGSPTAFASLQEFLSQEPFRAEKRIGIFLGAWIGGVIEKEGVKTTPYPDNTQIIEAVIAGEIAAGIVTIENAAWYLHRNAGAFSTFEIFKVDRNFRWNIGMGMRKSDAALIEVLDQSLTRLTADCSLERILTRYGLIFLPPFPGT
jgi:ABC-type amino acid transport substrate-binding protein